MKLIIKNMIQLKKTTVLYDSIAAPLKLLRLEFISSGRHFTIQVCDEQKTSGTEKQKHAKTFK